MKKFIGLVAALALVAIAAQAYAGPNQSVVVTPHGSLDGADTNGDPCTAIPLPELCEDLSSESTPDGNGVEWFLIVAARDDDPLAFQTILFGVDNYDEVNLYIAQYGPCHQELVPLEIQSDDWPHGREGTAVTWAPSCLEGNLVPIYYFGIYTYGPGVIPLGDYFPNQHASVVSCTDPPVEDDIVMWGELGCGGAEGSNPCPLPTPARQTTWGQIKAVYQ